MDFYGREDTHKPKITLTNAKQLEWCKVHWTLEQWKHILWSDESRFTIWQSDKTNLGYGGCQENATCPNA